MGDDNGSNPWVRRRRFPLVAALFFAILIAGPFPFSPGIADTSRGTAFEGEGRHAGQVAWQGEVVAVLDGDSLKVRHGSETIEIRVYGIDAPEKGQPWGDKARSLAQSLAAGRRVTVHPRVTDTYGRLVAGVTLTDGSDWAGTMLSRGLAWQHLRYSRERELGLLEVEARSQRLGLWSDPLPTPPWVWKHRRHD
ncbi:MAG: thermonuclease family protein [Magnetococcales bacterium]|nr:thermonuclease family protein [Magnetococcales bacterium]